MHISRLVIRNFRNFKKAEFGFRKTVNTLIGENGSGKTNAFYAMRLLLDDTLSRNAGSLREQDFSRRLEDWKGHWIVIQLDFAELDTSDGCQLIRHAVGHMTDQCEGSYALLFRPKKAARKKLYDMSEAGEKKETLEEGIAALTLDDYEAQYLGRVTADFLDDDVYTALVGDFVKMEFPDPEEEDLEVVGVPVASPLHKEVSCTFVQALRDVVSDLRGYRGNPLLQLLRKGGRWFQNDLRLKKSLQYGSL